MNRPLTQPEAEIQAAIYMEIIERDRRQFTELALQNKLPDTVTHFTTSNGTPMKMINGGMP